MKKFSLLLAFASASAFGWGDVGHRVVGEIAQSHLTARTKAAIHAFFAQESLARAATWPDEVRSDPAYTWATPLHFMEIPDGVTFDDHFQHPAAGDVYTALQKMQSTLRDPAATAQAKTEALRFSVHFIGDLHQPLHVGNGTDRGANLCSVKFFGQITNLHSVIDDGLIDRLKLSFTEYARFLNDAMTPEQIKEWQSTPLETWITESQQLRDQLYPKLVVNGQEQAGRPYCASAASEKPEKVDERNMPDISYVYVFQKRPLVDQRLSQAGIRLAGWLNEIFDGKHPAKKKELSSRLPAAKN